ncbi:MAG: ribonuclease Z [Myxococcales bacterium]|nr:ribonuclease Z [Myxococcales bacterium]
MSAREITFLGTASQVPTRHRNHNGIFVRFDTLGILIDPGEGTQRQLLLAGIAATQITHILITHFHGDHCLGLAALSQRISLDRVPHPVEVIYPASGQVFFERLRYASIYKEQAELVPKPIQLAPDAPDGPILVTESKAAKVKIWARPLHHRVECFGYRIEEADGHRMLPERLTQLGIKGADIKRLQTDGQLQQHGQTIRLSDVSAPRLGQKVTVVMDSRPCPNAVRLAEGADVLVSEATFTREHEHEAHEYAHMTAEQAARIAQQAGVRKLVLTHFSQRYQSTAGHIAEAAAVFPDVVAAEDFSRVAVPPRRDDPST